MRNKLLFTAAMICVEMTPFGRVHTAAQAADGALDLYGVDDDVVNASYDSDANLQSVKNSVSGGNNQPANKQPQADNFAAQPGASVKGQDRLYTMRQDPSPPVYLKGQSAGGLSGNNNVELNNNYLRITSGSPGQIFTGSITGERGTTNGYVDVLKSGGLDINSGQDVNPSALTTPNVVTLSGNNSRSNYNGYTFIRGQGALVLQDGAQVKSQGVTEIGLAKNDSASLIVDGDGSKFDLSDDKKAADTPSSTSGVLYVANNDGTYNGQAGFQTVTDAERKQSNTLLVQNGGEASARTVVVANREGANGTIYVTNKDPSTGHGARLNIGDGGLTITAGTGNVIVDRGAKIDSKGVISFGGAQQSDGTLDFDYRTVDGHLTVGDNGTLVAGDAMASHSWLNTSTGKQSTAFNNNATGNYGRTDGIVQNFGQDNRTDSLAYSNGNSTFSIKNGTLANQGEGNSGTPLHTNMDIGIAGNATFNATDASSKAAAPTDPISGLGDRTGITVAGNITNADKGQVGNLVKTGSGTLTLLGNNSYTGTTSVQNGTLQLGGIVGSSTPSKTSSNMYEQRVDARLFETDAGVRSLKEQTTEQTVDNVEPAVDQVLAAKNINLTQEQREALYLNFFNSSQLQDKLNQNQIPELQQKLEDYKNSSTYKQALQQAYNDSGKIDPSSKVVLGDTGKLNLAWGVNTNGDAPDPASRETSRTIANDISGTGQLERDVTDGVEGQSAAVLDQADSITHLTGKVALGSGKGSSDTALLVRKGNLSVDNSGSVDISGKRDIVVGSDLAGNNNQLLVQDGGTVTDHGGDMVIGQDRTGNGRVVVSNANTPDKSTSINMLRQNGAGGNIVVGEAGTGALNIGSQTGGAAASPTKGESVSLGGNLVIGDKTGSSGAVTVGDSIAGHPDITSHLTLTGSGETGKIQVGNSGSGLLSVYSSGVASAYGASVGGRNSYLNVGTDNATNGLPLYGGQLLLGAGGLTIDGSAGGMVMTTISAGGVAQSLGQVDVKQSGILSVGHALSPAGTDSDPSRQGRLIAGDTDGTPGIKIEKTGTATLYANGVIQNFSDRDLTIGGEGTLGLDDKAAIADATQHGTFDVTPGRNMYVADGLVDSKDGAGGLTKDGQGTLYLETNNSYTGKTDVKQGTLALAGPTLNNMHKENGVDVGYESSNSNSNITVEDKAKLTGYTSTDTSDGGKNYAAAGVTTAEAGGTVEANWNNSYGALNIGGYNHTGTALTMNDSADGTKHATLSVGGDTQKTGNSFVLGQEVKGYDRTGGVISTKAMSVAGTYHQLQSGVINVNGDAVLNNATINLQKNDNGRLYAGDAYRILTATGKVTAGGGNALTGNVPAAVANTPYLGLSLAIEDRDVDVLINRNGNSFGYVGNTRNERETGHGLDGLPSNSAVFHAMTGMTSAAEARRALNNLSGEIHASARSALIQDSYLLEQAVLDRLADSDCDGNNIITHGRYDLHDHRKNGRCYNDHAILWGQAYGSMGHNASDGNASTLHHQTAGFIMGVDTPVDDHWRVGGMVAYGRSMFNANNSVNSSGNSNNISIGAYAGSHWGRLNLRLGGFYSWNLMNMRRQVQVADFGGRQTSHYRNGTARVFGELGYKMKFQRLEFEPFAGLSYVNQYAGSFREHGVAALYSKGQDDGVLFSNFGFRTAYNFNIGRMQMRAHAMGAYRHAFGGIVSSRQQALIGSTNDMSIGGVPLSRDSAIVKTGITAKLSDRIDVDLSYIGQYGNQSIESGATGSVRFTF